MDYPEDLMPALTEVRSLGCCNMFDFPCVIAAMKGCGYPDTANWLERHRDNYLDLLVGDFSQWLDAHPSSPRESLARRVARETGLEVIQD